MTTSIRLTLLARYMLNQWHVIGQHQLPLVNELASLSGLMYPIQHLFAIHAISVMGRDDTQQNCICTM